MKVGDLVENLSIWSADEFGVSGIVVRIERFGGDCIRCRVAYGGGSIWQSPKEIKKLNKT